MDLKELNCFQVTSTAPRSELKTNYKKIKVFSSQEGNSTVPASAQKSQLAKKQGTAHKEGERQSLSKTN
jgi:hypothetical protein